MLNSWNSGGANFLQVLLWGVGGLFIIPCTLFTAGSWLCFPVGVIALGRMLELAPALDAEAQRRSS